MPNAKCHAMQSDAMQMVQKMADNWTQTHTQQRGDVETCLGVHALIGTILVELFVFGGVVVCRLVLNTFLPLLLRLLLPRHQLLLLRTLQSQAPTVPLPTQAQS